MMKVYIDLFLIFVKVGCIIFGGGYAMIPVIERELRTDKINKKSWTAMDEVMDYYTIAQATPGIVAINVSALYWIFKREGTFGGTITTLGFILPGISS